MVPVVHYEWTDVDPHLREELKYLGWAIEVQKFLMSSMSSMSSTSPPKKEEELSVSLRFSIRAFVL